ncbi:MAG TPA: hypothetical protein VEQ40_13855 [Pyrinomonadaceae bacterium]|nr:hypothetical protein [Pyrinomonadaceae bacterium]
MKDDYLWDKSGEPDLEIEHLERVLGGLRSKRSAQGLMPAFDNLQRKRPRPFTTWLAVAAAVAFALTALGIFNAVQRQSGKRSSDSQFVMLNPEAAESPVEDVARANGSGETREADSEKPSTDAVRTLKRSPMEARRRNINRRRESLLNRQEQMEGLMAKEQLLKALEITSSELDSVQKQVRGDEKPGPTS